MGATIKGVAVVFSIGDITWTNGIVSGTNANYPQSLTLTQESDTQEIRGGAGAVTGKVFYNFKRTVTITVVPYHATLLASAKSGWEAYIPAPGTKVTLADADGSLLDGGTTLDWNVITATGNKTVDGVATVDLTLEAYIENSTVQSTSAS